MSETKPAMTLGALDTTVGLALRDLGLGPASVSRSSAYHDYVALMFAIPHPTEDHKALVWDRFATLCARHDWQCLSVVCHRKTNEITVTIRERNVIWRNSDRRMPL
jgi:hypothetical protein